MRGVGVSQGSAYVLVCGVLCESSRQAYFREPSLHANICICVQMTPPVGSCLFLLPSSASLRPPPTPALPILLARFTFLLPFRFQGVLRVCERGVEYVLRYQERATLLGGELVVAGTKTNIGTVGVCYVVPLSIECFFLLGLF